MTRVRLRIAYRGTRYHGWQTQPGCATVQGEILRALARVLALPVEELTLQGASRTDAGVHALAQTAHFDHHSDRDEWTFVRGINALTPDDITILRAEEVSEDFDARRSTGGKIYRYQIWNHRFPHPLHTEDMWHVLHPLDLDRMRQAAEKLIGEHDFAGFRAADCEVPTTTRHIRRVELEQDGPLITLWVEGNAFMKYMVRIITGTLMAVGRGQLSPEVIDQMIATGNRQLGGPTAPPHGLTLMHIFYPDHPWTRGEPEVGGVW